MAGETSKGKRPQVPKVFSQKAQQAAVMAQANLDLLKAQTDAAFAQRKANLKVTQERLKFRGQQLDMAAQARADAAAAQQQDAAENPVGPEIEAMPYPDATSPSSSLAGTGNLGAILAANPGGVQGGAAVQQATGGTGTAEPSGVNPAALQSQVAPFNVSQNTVNRTVPIQYPGFVAQVPQSVTETQITPNQLSPYELGMLRQNAAELQAKQADLQQKNLARWMKFDLEGQKVASQLVKDEAQTRAANALTNVRNLDFQKGQFEYLKSRVAEYGTPLADLYALGLEGRIGKEEMKAREKNILGSIPDPQLRSAVSEFAQRTLAEVQAKRSLSRQGLSIQTNPDGSVNVAQGDAASILKDQASLESNTQRTLSFRRMQAGASGLDQIDTFLSIVAPGGVPDPTLLGSGGSATKLTTHVIGALKGIAPRLEAEIENDLKKDLVKVQQDPNLSPQEKSQTYEIYLQLKRDFKANLNPYQPTAIGAIGVMINAMRATLARAELGGELNVRGYEALSKDFIDPTGLKSPEEALSALKQVRTRFTQQMNLGKADYERMGGSPNLTINQIIGKEPMPRLEIPGPEVQASDIYTDINPSLKPRISEEKEGDRIWDPSELK